MINQYCEKKRPKEEQKVSQQQIPNDPDLDQPWDKNLTLEEKYEQKRKFGNAIMQYWSKSRGFINSEKFNQKFKGFNCVPSANVAQKFYQQVLE